MTTKMELDNTKKNRVYYVGFYSDLESGNDVERYVSPAAIDKMNYIAQVIIRHGYELEIISPSWLKNKEFSFLKGKTIFHGEELIVDYAPSFSTPFRITKFLSKYFSLFWLFWQLISKLNKDDNVLVYHSVFLYRPISLAKKVKKFNLILEVEEIYHLYTHCSKRQENALISLADSYILSNQLLINYLKSIENKRKPFSILYGAYKVLMIPKKERASHDLVKVVYAGVIEEQKRGAFNSVICSEKLSNKYKVLIIGFGTQEYINNLKIEIERINSKAGYIKCEYLGVKYGLDYDDFLFSCDIAIIPQEPDDSFINFGFPSKILSYLSHNLRTVSSKLECIAASEFADYVVMVPIFSSENFAKAIMDLDLQMPFNAIEKIREADKIFSLEIKTLIKGK